MCTGIAFCNVILTLAKTEFLCKRQYTCKGHGSKELGEGCRQGSIWTLNDPNIAVWPSLLASMQMTWQKGQKHESSSCCEEEIVSYQFEIFLMSIEMYV